MGHVLKKKKTHAEYTLKVGCMFLNAFSTNIKITYIAQVVSVIVQCHSNPMPKNRSIVQRIFRYLRGTSHDRLKFQSDGTTRIIGDYDFD
jgi:hypothetical protein